MEGLGKDACEPNNKVNRNNYDNNFTDSAILVLGKTITYWNFNLHNT